MNIRELARKAGGEKAVAEIDAAAKIEQIAAKQINEIIEATLKGKEGREEMLVLTALCEALSACLANVVAVTTLKAYKGDRTSGIMTAIQSLGGNLNQAFDDLDALAAGVSDHITAAAKKGAK